MPRQLHSAPAAAAMTLVLCIAGFSFIIFALLASGSVHAYPDIAVSRLRNGVGNLGKAAGIVVLLGYSIGIAGWLAMFVMRRDGMHRMAAILSGKRGKMS